MQHVLSEGVTNYRPLVGALITTGVLMVLSGVTSLITSRRMYFLPALYHLPSALVLAIITDIHVVEWEGGHILGNTWVIGLVLALLFILFSRFLRNFILPSAASSPIMLLRCLTGNLVLLFSMGLFVVYCGNTNEKAHLSLHSEYILRDNKYAEASTIGFKQRYCDEHLLTLRAYAMAKTNQMGEKFFENSVKAGSECLLPSTDNPLLMFPVERIYKMLGGVKPAEMPVAEYLSLLHKRGQLKEGGRDYIYIAAMLDGNLDAFAEYFAERYDSTMVVPKHYREALTLYNHLRAQPIIDYSVPEMEADYDDFQALVRKNPDRTKRMNALRDNYGNTYWYYYFNLISF